MKRLNGSGYIFHVSTFPSTPHWNQIPWYIWYSKIGAGKYMLLYLTKSKREREVFQTFLMYIYNEMKIYNKNCIYCIIDGDFIKTIYKKKKKKKFKLKSFFFIHLGDGGWVAWGVCALKRIPVLTDFSLFWCCRFDLAEINLHWALETGFTACIKCIAGGKI